MLQRMPDFEPEVQSQLPGALTAAPCTALVTAEFHGPSHTRPSPRALILATSRVMLDASIRPMGSPPPSDGISPTLPQCPAVVSFVMPPWRIAKPSEHCVP